MCLERCSQSEAAWCGSECADGPQEPSTELLSQGVDTTAEGHVASAEISGQGTGSGLATAFEKCRADLGCCLESLAHVVREPGLPEEETRPAQPDLNHPHRPHPSLPLGLLTWDPNDQFFIQGLIRAAWPPRTSFFVLCVPGKEGPQHPGTR